MRLIGACCLLAAWLPVPAFAQTAMQDSNSAAFQGEVPMTVGTSYPAQRSVKANCTAAGNVSVTYVDGSTGIWAVVVGIQTIPIAATTITASGTTATCTYAELR